MSTTLATRTPGTVGMTARYALMSTRNVYRNVRFLVLTVALPLLLFLLYVNLYQGQDTGNGISVVAYLMVSMASFGCIGAAINTGARIAVERQTGWNRQLRLTALPARGYLVAKAVVSMLVTLPALVLVFIAGATVGDVSLDGRRVAGDRPCRVARPDPVRGARSGHRIRRHRRHRAADLDDHLPGPVHPRRAVVPGRAVPRVPAGRREGDPVVLAGRPRSQRARR